MPWDLDRTKPTFDDPNLATYWPQRRSGRSRL